MSMYLKGITFCGCFYFLRFPRTLLHIGSLKDPFISFYMTFEQTWFIMADRWFVVKDVQRDDYRLWITNNWHHICLSFDSITMQVVFVKVVSIYNKCNVDLVLTKQTCYFRMDF